MKGFSNKTKMFNYNFSIFCSKNYFPPVKTTISRTNNFSFWTKKISFQEFQQEAMTSSNKQKYLINLLNVSSLMNLCFCFFFRFSSDDYFHKIYSKTIRGTFSRILHRAGERSWYHHADTINWILHQWLMNGGK